MNCHRNYPWYRGWNQSFAKKGLTVIGVHSPETESEKNIDEVRRKVNEESFEFPIVVDTDKKIWDRWGNGIWPAVYLIDKRGRIRYWWYGELNWQGAKGEKIMRKKIAELLAEKE